MQVWRINIGLWRSTRPIKLRDYFTLEYDKGVCGCRILTIGRVCVEFLGDECYYHEGD